MKQLGTLTLKGLGSLTLEDLGALILYTASDHIPLSMPNVYGVHEYQLPMFMQVDEGFIQWPNATMWMFIRDNLAANGILNMYLYNTGLTTGIPMAIKGEGLYPGYMPANKSIPLYIHTKNLLQSIPMYCNTQAPPINGVCPMYIKGGLSASLSMCIPNVDYVWSDSINGFIRMCIPAFTNQSIPLSVLNAQPKNSHVLLMLRNTGINSVLPMFVKTGLGIYGAASCPLVIPIIQTKNHIPLYTHGY